MERRATAPDVYKCRKLKMAAAKPEVVLAFVAVLEKYDLKS